MGFCNQMYQKNASLKYLEKKIKKKEIIKINNIEWKKKWKKTYFQCSKVWCSKLQPA
jgi:hypothetical protein